MVTEIEVAWFVERHEVDVHMRHIDTHHGLAHLDAWADLFQAFGHALGEEVKFAKEFVVKVEDVIDFLLGDTEHMATHNRVDVEEGQATVGFKHLVAGDFARHYLTENTCHN